MRICWALAPMVATHIVTASAASRLTRFCFKYFIAFLFIGSRKPGQHRWIYLGDGPQAHLVPLARETLHSELLSTPINTLGLTVVPVGCGNRGEYDVQQADVKTEGRELDADRSEHELRVRATRSAR